MSFVAFIVAWYTLFFLLRALYMHWETALLRGKRQQFRTYRRWRRTAEIVLNHHVLLLLLAMLSVPWHWLPPALRQVEGSWGVQTLIALFLLMETVYTGSGIAGRALQARRLSGRAAQAGGKYLILSRLAPFLCRALLIGLITLAASEPEVQKQSPHYALFIMLIYLFVFEFYHIPTRFVGIVSNDQQFVTEVRRIHASILQEEEHPTCHGALYSSENTPPPFIVLREMADRWSRSRGGHFFCPKPVIDTLKQETATAIIALRAAWSRRALPGIIDTERPIGKWMAILLTVSFAVIAAYAFAPFRLPLAIVMAVLFGGWLAFAVYHFANREPLEVTWATAFEAWRDAGQDRTVTDFLEQIARLEYLQCHNPRVAVQLARTNPGIQQFLSRSLSNERDSNRLWNEILSRLQRHHVRPGT